MKRKIFLATTIFSGIFFITRCNTSPNSDNEVREINPVRDTLSADKGMGRFKEVPLTHPLNDTDVIEGQAIYKAKCFSCHKLTTEKLIGPGLHGVTDRRTPEWIMNFMTNTSVMLDSDAIAQQLMVTCNARMPNQNLTDDDARDMLEFLRKNDGKN